nr:mucin-5AC-like [Cherax quadricarinatus]
MNHPPSSLCVDVVGVGRQVDNSLGAVTTPRSPTPPSSQGSKSNSPLLNGHANSITAGGLAKKPHAFSGSFFGKGESFTKSPSIKDKSPPGSKTSGESVPAIPPPPVTAIPAPASVPSITTDVIITSASNGLPNSSLVTGWQNRITNQPGQAGVPNMTMSEGSGIKMSISGPSLQGSTNPAIAPHIPKSVLPTRVAPPLPPIVTATGNAQTVSTYMPPVAVITPYRKVPSLVTRPLSVPDASILITQACKQGENHDENFEIKRQEGDKQSAVARIASFLTKKDKQGLENNEVDVEAGRANTLPRKAAKIKRESLVQLEISAPMQLHATELPANLVPVRTAPDPPMPSNVKPSQVKAAQEEISKPNKVSWAPSVPEDKVKTPTTGDSRSNIRVTWTPSVIEKNDTNKELQRIGSMRETPVTIRPAIPKFGSMRAPRPKSLPPTRPSEPPPRPPLPTIPGTPESECFYDDCLNIQEGSAPIADIEDDTTPSENIYATIDDRTPDKEIPLQEVTYLPPDIVNGKKEKKSIFSFLYNKPKKKESKDKNLPEEDTASEPVYTNLIESPPDHEVDVEKVESPLASDISPSLSSPSPTLLDSQRTSCGSSEDGGLLSEIVTELSTRDAEFVSTLAKRKKSKGGDQEHKTNKTSESRSLTSQDSRVNTSQNSEAILHTKTSDANIGSKMVSSNGMSKSTSYPWRSKKVPDVMKKSSTSASTSPNEDAIISDNLPKASILNSHTSNIPLKPVPRGVFSYLNAGNSNTATTVPATTSVTSTVTPATLKSLSLINSKSSPVIPTTPTVNTTTPSTTNTPASMTLAASLAAVRAAGAAAGEAAATATLAASNSKFVKTTDNSHSSKFQSLKPNLREREVPGQSVISKTAVTPPASTINASSNISAPVLTVTTARTAEIQKTVPSTATKISSVAQPNRPVFPPDKVLFPADKVITQNATEKMTKMEALPDTSKTSDFKESSATSSGGSNVARGRGSSPASKVTSSVSKPGRLLSPSQSATPTRGVTPLRTTTTIGSGRGEKSRSTTPQPGAKKTTGTGNKADQKVGSKPSEKPGNKTTDKTGTKTGTKTADKQVEKAGPKKAATKSMPTVSKPSTGQVSRPGSASGISGINRSGRISNSHVASLQQKFEKKESEVQDQKTVTKTPSRKSQEVKPVVAPKPK